MVKRGGGLGQNYGESWSKVEWYWSKVWWSWSSLTPIWPEVKNLLL